MLRITYFPVEDRKALKVTRGKCDHVNQPFLMRERTVRALVMPQATMWLALHAALLAPESQLWTPGEDQVILRVRQPTQYIQPSAPDISTPVLFSSAWSFGASLARRWACCITG